MVKFIGAGLPRTGTLSLKHALDQLGFGPCFHGLNVFESPHIIDTAYAAAKGEGGDVDWSNVFDKKFQAAVDFPSAIFFRELMTAYPDAKVILTVRNPETWYKSLFETAYQIRDKDFPEIGAATSSKLQWLTWSYLLQERMGEKDAAIKVFNDHVDLVKRTVSEEKLLVFSVKEGWEPLCSFLGVPVPDTPFPNVNDRQALHNKLSGLTDKPGLPKDMFTK